MKETVNEWILNVICLIIGFLLLLEGVYLFEKSRDPIDKKNRMEERTTENHAGCEEVIPPHVPFHKSSA